MYKVKKHLFHLHVQRLNNSFQNLFYFLPLKLIVFRVLSLHVINHFMCAKRDQLKEM